MTKAKRILALSLFLLSGVGIAPSVASADRTLRMSIPGWAAVGQISGVAYLVILPWDGSPCRFTNLGNGGLQDNLIIYGTQSADWIVPVISTSTHCGSTINPLLQNGFFLSVIGDGGNDLVSGGSGPNDDTRGDAGNDIVYAPFLGGDAVGGHGADKVYGRDHPQDRLWGDAGVADSGNDNLCQHSSTTCALMNGGAGSDTHCGNATTFTSIETPNCSACGTGF
jgi:hypothetical protein